VKKLSFGAVLLFAVAVGGVGFGANALVTQIQAAVNSALVELKFEPIEAKGGVIGGPSKFKVTQATLDHLAKVLEDGKTITIDSKGKLTFGTDAN
jgi:hypothetical protein